MREERRSDAAEGDSAEGNDEVPPPPPSFWIMIGLAVLYLGWRLVQGVVWLIDRLA